MTDKKISIIVPAYNVENYVGECIESLIAQTYKNLEVIIVDDGSKDNTGKIIDQYAEKDKRILVVHQKNGGLPHARNTGLQYASGDYIMFLDSDDWLDMNCCEIVLNKIQSFDADLLFFEYSKEYKNKTVKMKTYGQKELKFDLTGVKEFFLYDMRTITAWGKIYKSEIIGNQRYNESMKTAEDVDFNFRVYKKTKRALYIDDNLLHYRILENSAIHGFDPKIDDKLSNVIDSLYEWAQEDFEHMEAYYSFVAIAYILICQNKICSNPGLNFLKKVSEISRIGENSSYKKLFDNIDKVKIPKSRKLIVWLGKRRFYFCIAIIVNMKLKNEDRA